MSKTKQTPHRIVLTGGPCAGKTTVIEVVKREYAEHVLVVPEVVTMLFSAGYPKPGIDVPLNDEWFIDFERVVVPLQQNMEAQYLAMASEKGLGTILCDRGLMDPAAYYPGGREAYLHTFSLEKEDIWERYNLVIHLESVAVSNPKLYEELAHADPTHYESSTLAQARDRQLREVWEGHPNAKHVSSAQGIEHVISQAHHLLQPYILKNDHGL